MDLIAYEKLKAKTHPNIVFALKDFVIKAYRKFFHLRFAGPRTFGGRRGGKGCCLEADDGFGDGWNQDLRLPGHLPEGLGHRSTHY